MKWIINITAIIHSSLIILCEFNSHNNLIQFLELSENKILSNTKKFSTLTFSIWIPQWSQTRNNEAYAVIGYYQYFLCCYYVWPWPVLLYYNSIDGLSCSGEMDTKRGQRITIIFIENVIKWAAENKSYCRNPQHQFRYILLVLRHGHVKSC